MDLWESALSCWASVDAADHYSCQTSETYYPHDIMPSESDGSVVGDRSYFGSTECGLEPVYQAGVLLDS